tara:strand:+ start:440 stop:988 length:549 start_codon:yes stop_codon:yes gene_type:complete
MANRKRRCRNCKKYKVAEDGLVINNGFYCDIDCATQYGFKNKEKGKEIKHKAQKKAYNENKLSTRKRATKEACHEYIRLRDKNNLCICCSEPLGDDYHAGHFLESGNNPKVRYDEDNIHAQRAYCNTYKGGDSGMYKENLIEKIGIERVERLLSLKGGTVKRNADDYREVERYYKGKIKDLK